MAKMGFITLAMVINIGAIRRIYVTRQEYNGIVGGRASYAVGVERNGYGLASHDYTALSLLHYGEWTLLLLVMAGITPRHASLLICAPANGSGQGDRATPPATTYDMRRRYWSQYNVCYVMNKNGCLVGASGGPVTYRHHRYVGMRSVRVVVIRHIRSATSRDVCSIIEMAR